MAFLVLGTLDTQAQTPSRIAIKKPASGNGVVLDNESGEKTIFHINGQEKMRLTELGRLGIGIDPLYPFHLSATTSGEPFATAYITSPSGPAGLAISVEPTQQAHLRFLKGDNIMWQLRTPFQSNDDLHITSWGLENPTDIMTWQYSTGNVGIGTTSPSEKLDVTGNLVLGEKNGNAGVLKFRRKSDGGTSMRMGFGGSTGQSDFQMINDSGDGYITFHTWNGSLTEKMRIANNGNVGIGTTNPQGFKLNVAGKSFMNSLDIQSARNSNSTSEGITINPNDTYTYTQITQDIWGGSHGILFNCYKNTANGSLSADNNVNFANNVGVHQSGAGSIVFDGNGGNMYFLISGLSSGKNNPVSWGGSILTLHRNGDATFRGNVTANSQQLTSDARFKKDIQTLTTSKVAKLDQVRGTSYQFRNNEFKDRHFSKRVQMGFIAQELIKVYPELVSKDAEGYYSVNYTGLIPVLVEAVKDLRKNNGALKRDNQAIKAELDTLKARMETLEKLLLKAKK